MRVRRQHSGGGRSPRFRSVIGIAATIGLVATGLVSGVGGAGAAPAPVGNGFIVTANDLDFILKQIKIAERHSATFTDTDPCGTLVGPGPDQVPDRLTSYGLRTVDGSCNNLFAGRETFAAADVPFPRLATPVFRDAEPNDGTFGPDTGDTSYKQKLAGNVVVDSQPRVISNLIVDQTSTNPAAVEAAGFPVRTQGNQGVFPCDANNLPVDCVPAHKTLFIPNVTTDVGLSPPFNSLFTFFGQFFDHGVDQTVKSGGTVFVPLHADDPLLTLGPDGDPNTPDQVAPQNAFMVITRAQNQPGLDGQLGTADDIQDANNTDSPWVDQSQTYTSHSSHQVFLREYTNNTAGRPVSTGKLLGGLDAGLTYNGSPDGRDGISTWAATKKQAAELLGLQLVDTDVTNIPMIAADPYGNFLPGPLRGLPQYVTESGLVEGCRTTDGCGGPVLVPADTLHFDTPFLTDIAHNADPSMQDTNLDGVPDTFPTPDVDDTTSSDFKNQPAGTYDDELLNAHFTCGDGRCNENIALSTIHQIFHSEHDRLVEDIINTLNANPTLRAQYQAAHPFGASNADISFGLGGRLFQAARFVTEMEYQHLVFEEFARKMVPAVRVFHVYTPDINPAVEAEFAHAVYRFGHSMLDDDVARTDVDPNTGAKTDNSLPLLQAFLNPPEFFDGSQGTLTPKQAAGSIIMGSSDQVGNEIDEFVTEVLRNNLLGLPLDLPTLNMTRARSEGIPPLNQVRRDIFGQTNDGQLAPYTDWSDFGNHLKHPESLINFIAAYGTHPTIIAEETMAGKRAAAKRIVDPADPSDPLIPTDAADFMFSSGAWANTAAGVTKTGLDSVDLWVGGLAEVTNLFGSLLGSTFTYVFQTQLEKLQDGDRFYYLARTPGMNLRTQLEGNSFSELIERNTEGTNTLKADAFSTADCKFQLANITFPATALNPDGIANSGDENTVFSAGSVNNDPTTECNENQLLVRSPDGTIAYRQRNTVDPSGINGQSVYNGGPLADRIKGGNDNDTFWGNAGNDVIDGQGGDDVALGGDGNDILTDLDGADVPKGGPGNDAIDAGPGDDIPMGNDGQDFINGGANDNETFAGEGNDFIIAGQGADAVFGDGGDDWIEGGTGQDLLQGDHSAPFFDDPAEVAPGNDFFVGQAGENDYDAEGGDDVMAQNAFVDRNAGAGGFDWAFHQYDTVGADDDMEINNNLVGVPIQLVINRDRWQETEANSGSAFNDIIRGTSEAPATIGGAGFTGCDALDAAGVARITGLNALVTPAMLTTPASTVVDLSAAGRCPLSGNVWGDGDILIGGAGSDTIEGRGADDIIDGDRALRIRISVRTDPANPASEIGTTDLMEGLAAAGGNFGLNTAGMTLQQAVFAGIVDPGNLVAVREIINTPGPTDVDTAVFTGPRANYTVTRNADGSLSVVDNAAVPVDGNDTLRNIERLQFSDVTVNVAPTVALTAPADLATVSGTVPFSASVVPGIFNVVGVRFLVDGVTQIGAEDTTSPYSVQWNTTATANGTHSLTAVVRDTVGQTVTSTARTVTVNNTVDTVAPTVTARSPLAGAINVPVNTNVTATFSENVTGVTGNILVAGTFRLRNAAGNTIPAAISYNATTHVATLDPLLNLGQGVTFTATLTGGAAAIRDLAGNPLATTSWTFTTVDTTAPTVTARNPANNATAVPVTVRPTVTFSEAVNGVTGPTNVSLLVAGNPVPSTVAYNATTRVATITPAAPLANDTRYTVQLSGITDLSGNALAAGSATATFLTGPAPTVTARTPAVNATAVSRTANITATFNENMNAATVVGTNVTLRQGTGAAGALIASVISYNAVTRIVTINPNATLNANQVYTVRLTTGLTDAAGNPLPAVTWSFTTGAV